MISQYRKIILRNFARNIPSLKAQEDLQKEKDLDKLRGQYAAEKMFKNLKINKPKNFDKLSEKQLKETSITTKQYHHLKQEVYEIKELPENVRNYHFIQKIQYPKILLNMYRERKFYFSEYNYVSFMQRLYKLMRKLERQKNITKFNIEFLKNVKHVKDNIFQDFIYTIKQNFQNFNIGVQLSILTETYDLIANKMYYNVMGDQYQIFVKNESHLKLNNKKLLKFMILTKAINRTDKNAFVQCDKLMLKYLKNMVIKKELEVTTPELVESLKTEKQQKIDENLQRQLFFFQEEDKLRQLGLLQSDERQQYIQDDFGEEFIQKEDQDLINHFIKQEQSQQKSIEKSEELSIFTTQQLIRIINVYQFVKIESECPFLAFDAVMQSPYLDITPIQSFNIIFNYVGQVNRARQVRFFNAIYNIYLKDWPQKNVFENDSSRVQSEYIYNIVKLQKNKQKNFFTPLESDSEELTDLRQKIMKINDEIFVNFVGKNFIKTHEIANIFEYMYLYKPEMNKNLIKNILKNTFHFSQHFDNLQLARCVYHASKIYENTTLRDKYNMDWNNYFNFLIKKLEMFYRNLDRASVQLLKKVIMKEIPQLKNLKYILQQFRDQLKKLFKIFCNGRK